MKLEDDHFCFGCGTQNKEGLKLSFELKDDALYSEFVPSKKFQGFKDIVHGGIIGLILDELMVNLLWKRGTPAVSAQLDIRLKKMANVGQKLLFKSFVEKEDRRIIYTKAEARDINSDLIATASAKCVRIGRF